MDRVGNASIYLCFAELLKTEKTSLAFKFLDGNEIKSIIKFQKQFMNSKKPKNLQPAIKDQFPDSRGSLTAQG